MSFSPFVSALVTISVAASPTTTPYPSNTSTAARSLQPSASVAVSPSTFVSPSDYVSPSALATLTATSTPAACPSCPVCEPLAAPLVQSSVISIVLSFLLFGGLTYVIGVKSCYNRCLRLVPRFPCPYCDVVYLAMDMKTHLSTCDIHLEEMNLKDGVTLRIAETT
jgi:hypothetical protein